MMTAQDSVNITYTLGKAEVYKYFTSKMTLLAFRHRAKLLCVYGSNDKVVVMTGASESTGTPNKFEEKDFNHLSISFTKIGLSEKELGDYYNIVSTLSLAIKVTRQKHNFYEIFLLNNSCTWNSTVSLFL